jgi:hypothetical protein
MAELGAVLAGGISATAELLQTRYQNTKFGTLWGSANRRPSRAFPFSCLMRPMHEYETVPNVRVTEVGA